MHHMVRECLIFRVLTEFHNQVFFFPTPRSITFVLKYYLTSAFHTFNAFFLFVIFLWIHYDYSLSSLLSY